MRGHVDMKSGHGGGQRADGPGGAVLWWPRTRQRRRDGLISPLVVSVGHARPLKTWPTSCPQRGAADVGEKERDRPATSVADGVRRPVAAVAPVGGASHTERCTDGMGYLLCLGAPGRSSLHGTKLLAFQEMICRAMATIRKAGNGIRRFSKGRKALEHQQSR